MKKAVSLIVFIFVLFSALSQTFAATAASSLKSIKYSRSGGQDFITINTAKYTGYTVTWLKSPDRLVIDIPNNKVTIQGSQTMKVNSSLVKSIRFSQFTKTAARIVIDTNGKPPYTVKTASGSLTFVLGKAASAQAANPQGSSGVSRGDVDRPESVLQRLVFSSSETYDKIIIPGSAHDGYNIFRLTDPDRVVIDVPNLALAADQQQIQAGGSYVKTVRTSSDGSNATRIVLDTSGQPNYRVEKSEDQISVILEAPTLKNLSYHNAGDRIYLALYNAELTEVVPAETVDGSADESAKESGTLKLLYSGGYDQSQIKYSMTFPGNLADLGYGSLQINDGVMSSIDISRNDADQTTTISFNAKSRLVYDTTTNPEINSTEISILKPYDAKDRLVVIDAGHGGSDPGAAYAGLQEKDLNLDIALRVNEILKSKGIKTYMTRDDDTFIPLKSRAEIANNLNAALFLSIHNNAFNSSEHGTETLYYPGSTGSAYARIVQDTLVKALGTYDRGIVQRPNLVVLNSTKMPAVIAEVAFMTNTDDRAKLTDSDFIQKAAEALAEAVIKALG